MATKTLEQDLGETLAAEIKRDAPVLAKALFGDVPSGMTKLSQPKFLELVKRNWPDPAFRIRMRRNLGAAEFLKLAKVIVPMLTDPNEAAEPAAEEMAETPAAEATEGGA